MQDILQRSGQIQRVKSAARWKAFWIALASLVLAIECTVLFNGPVGEATIVQGSTTQRCVPAGEQSNFFHCTAQLRDGSLQVLITLRPVESGAPVSFLRYSRRFFGYRYEPASF